MTPTRPKTRLDTDDSVVYNPDGKLYTVYSLLFARTGVKIKAMQSESLKQIERSDPLVEVVLQQIADGIIAGHLRPGDKLVEAKLGEQLGVSRGPVREAFRRLEQMGLVEKIPNRGAFVSTLTDRDVEELHTARELIEGLAARQLAAQRNPQAITRLEEILQEMRQTAAAGDQNRMIALDADFHDALVKLCGHKLLGDIWEIVRVHLRRFLLLKRKRLYRTLAEAAPLHEPIVEAIAAGDPDRAEAEARRHVVEAGRDLTRFAVGRDHIAEAEPA
jgi:DNA-binding GntR family transcriptional regulator